jgi:phytoene dehydrogenase-like protein
MALASPFFRSLPLKDFGLEWIFSPAEVAHPLETGEAGLIMRSIDLTSERLGKDGDSYRSLYRPLVNHWKGIIQDLLGPLPMPPRHPFSMARFGLEAIKPASKLTTQRFKTEKAQALVAGIAGHSVNSLDKAGTSGFSLTLGMLAHAVGWPIAAGGSQKISNALYDYYLSLGGKGITNNPIRSIRDIPEAKVVLFDISPRQFLRIVGEDLPSRYRNQLMKYRYAPGVFKIDYALDGPIPWRAVDCNRAITVHLGGTLNEIASAEKEVMAGHHPDRPFVLLSQQSLFDPTRAPSGNHTVWAYCHVPNGSDVDMTARIEAQIERFAPGFRDLILVRHTLNTSQLEAYNENYIGGDIIGGVTDLKQLYARPTPNLRPYKTPHKGYYLCSASTPPGGAVHGMCGYHAARMALKHEFHL